MDDTVYNTVPFGAGYKVDFEAQHCCIRTESFWYMPTEINLTMHLCRLVCPPSTDKPTR